MNDVTAPGAIDAATDHSRLLLPLSMLVLYVIWGSTYLGIRFALESWPPFLLVGVRLLIAGTLLFGFLRLRGVALPTPRQWRNAAVTGVLLLGISNGMMSFSEQYVSSGITAVALASMPLFATLFGIGYGHRPNRREALGLVVGFAGVIVLNLGSSLAGSHIAALALLLGAAAWAFGSVWSKQQDMPTGPMNTAAQMLCGSAAQFVMGFGGGEHLPAHVTLRAGLAMAYLVVFGSLIGFSAFLYALKHARPALATSYAYVNPPVAVLLGVLLAGEHISPSGIVGMMVILLGVAAIMTAHRRRN
ncbi:drug/metabolite exporter YedA [Rhodanobacter sp. 7MK24]|uniref:drug/metabolite exporter YedA n=1 Tax=Rhodanobacter sp. 7MK24 TaxID=2775922 RepID=UPI001780745D|nr:drug/metabolite exporter YedA [Rhodanobacter sp. 7MK24]MBD8881131.1 drug/metabolite exporter YedA [Rhodanobacter sp. 7MK24]